MGEIFLGLGANGERQVLNLGRANRHGLIAGATGTGKTVTLQGIAESFSAAGVPVFVADVKGDLSGIAMAGSPTFKHADKLEERAKEIGMTDYAYADNPAIFWDLYGEQGHPIRTTISEMGPLLLARLMDLNEMQEGVLNIVFRYADEQGLLLLDLDDLQAMLAHTAENADELTTKYGNVTKASVGTIQRQLLQLDSQGGGAILRRAGAGDRRFHRLRREGPRLHQRARRRQADAEPQALCAPSCCGCWPNCSRRCPKSATRKSPSWCSSSTRRICCSTMRPRRCRTRSSRSCG